jgi:hypothetical protein
MRSQVVFRKDHEHSPDSSNSESHYSYSQLKYGGFILRKLHYDILFVWYKTRVHVGYCIQKMLPLTRRIPQGKWFKSN